jgi:O-antigen/teichoic acid export membrane protein
MAAESRVKKSLLNARVNLIFYFLSLILSFFSRKIFLDTLGADFVGLTGTLYNLLAFLNLAELGIGSAIGYVLYKPLYDHDENKICEIIAVFGYLYRWIGLIILGLGCVLACFLPLIFPETGFDYGIIYFAYFSFLASSLIGYFANYKQTLLGADQRNYVVTAYFQTATIVKTLIQLASAYYTGSYYLWVAIELIFGILYSFILNWKINQVYPWLRSEVKQGKELFRKYPEVMKYTKQLFVHKMGEFAQFQITPFIIYAYTSLKTVAYYGNYSLIVSKIIFLLLTFLGSTNASIGNLVAEGNLIKVKKIFWELFSIRMFIIGLVFIALFYLLEPFIVLWLGKEYILDFSVFSLIIVSTCIGLMRRTCEQFLFAYGLFRDVYAPVIEFILTVVISIICGYFWGFAGVLLGGIISSFLVYLIWKPYFLFHNAFKNSYFMYWIQFCLHAILIMTPVFIIYRWIIPYISINPYSNFFAWIFYALTVVGSYTVATFILMYIFSQGMRDFANRLFAKKI